MGEGGVAGCCFVKVTRPLQWKDLEHPLCHFFSWGEEVSQDRHMLLARLLLIGYQIRCRQGVVQTWRVT